MTRTPTVMPPEDYEAIEAAVMETARGRWFLAEFARRNRSADTSVLLTAIERLESMMGNQSAPTTPHLPANEGLQPTSAKSELFALEPSLRAHGMMLTSVPDDVAWATVEEREELPSATRDVVEIDDQAPIWPTQSPAAPPPPPVVEAPPIQTPAPAQSAMLAAALAHAEQMASEPAEPEPETSPGGVSPPAADPAELDALSFEEKSVYFA